MKRLCTRRTALWVLATSLQVPLVSAATAAAPAGAVTADAAGRFVTLALACVHQEYPNKIGHTMASDRDALPPRLLTPAFYGCYDWHSAVHGHWLLARAARRWPAAAFAADARAALQRSLSADNIAAELNYYVGAGRESFERPYGLAWLLALATELRRWNDPQAAQWSRNLEPLETRVASRLADWLPKLHYPIRSGEHSQTAFALALIRDWAVARDQPEMRKLVDARATEFYLRDRDCPMSYEPSGEDFLSPCLAEADLMRRVLAPRAFAGWLTGFLPQLQRADARWLQPAIVTDREDPKLAHLDGLNLSRAWMLQGIAAGLPRGDPRRDRLLLNASRHANAALPWVTGEHYSGGHWLGTFALYLVTIAP